MYLENILCQLCMICVLLELIRAESCAELSQKTLIALLGQAFNSRYMSVDQPPVPEGDNATEAETENSIKRSFYEIQFFAKKDLVSNDEFPAWETDHLRFFEKKEREAKERAEKERAEKEKAAKEALLKKNNETKPTEPPMNKSQQTRSILVQRLTPKEAQPVIPKETTPQTSKETQVASKETKPPTPEEVQKKQGLFVVRPWECNAKINWIDLGYDYFPRYVRSLDCRGSTCWYGHYNCEPRSFTIKVLRRKHNRCAKVTDKLIMIVSEPFKEQYTELWIWEELAVNFCCDCAIVY